MNDILRAKPYNAILTIPNIVTSTGILLLIPYVYAFLTNKNRWIMFGALFFAAFSDLLDGFLARKLNQGTKLGEIIDPLRDRLLFLAMIVHFIFLYFIDITRNYIFLVSIAIFISAEIKIALFDMHWWKYKILEARMHKIRKVRQVGLVFVGGAAILNRYFEKIITKIIDDYMYIPLDITIVIMAAISLFTLFVYLKIYLKSKKR